MNLYYRLVLRQPGLPSPLSLLSLPSLLSLSILPSLPSLQSLQSLLSLQILPSPPVDHQHVFLLFRLQPPHPVNSVGSLPELHLPVGGQSTFSAADAQLGSTRSVFLVFGSEVLVQRRRTKPKKFFWKGGDII